MMWTLLTALGTDAFACGGLFCNVAQPVVQNAERIVFDVDRDEGLVEAHVQISYEGPSEEFAWVVPVATEPDLFLSSQALFDTLAVQTAPQFRLDVIEEGDCRSGNGGFIGVRGGSEDFLAPESPQADSGGVVVVAQAKVGPYETLTLQANSSTELLEFLQRNAYDLPDDLDPVLRPYVADGAYFVALRLSKNNDAGDIAPLGMRYAGEKASIPIQLTSIAAADDLRLEVYVFSDVRAVPETYLHVQINDAAIDWWNAGQNYPDVITQAADEAGGRAFATDYFGDAPGGYTIDPGLEGRLRAAETGSQWVNIALFETGVAINEEMAGVIAEAVGLPASIDPIDFANCPDCFGDWSQGPELDTAAATDLYAEFVIEPLVEAEDLFDRRRLTRMTSSLSANEMTEDPVFALNHDMDDEEDFVSNVRTAELVYDCEGGKLRNRAERRLILSDGRAIYLPSEKWIVDNQTSEFELISELGATKAKIIERTGESGEPEIIRDFTNRLFDLVDQHNANLLASCAGCRVGTGAPGLGVLGLLLAVVGLRRRGR